MADFTAAKRVRRLRQRRKDMGLVEVRLWLMPAQVKEAKQMEARALSSMQAGGAVEAINLKNRDEIVRYLIGTGEQDCIVNVKFHEKIVVRSSLYKLIGFYFDRNNNSIRGYFYLSEVSQLRDDLKTDYNCTVTVEPFVPVP